MSESDPMMRIQTPCQHMRSKEMYYQADEDDAFSSGVHWCNKTHENFGPDGEPAGKKQCCAGRSCYISMMG